MQQIGRERGSLHRHKRNFMTWRALVFGVLWALLHASSSSAQNGRWPLQPLLGTCLDAQWVSNMEQELNVSASARDDHFRLLHPSLHAAHKVPHYYVDDPRTANSVAYGSCLDRSLSDRWFQGFNTSFDANGTMISAGGANGALIVSLTEWHSHSLTSLVFSILVSEIIGFPVGFYMYTDAFGITKRMSSTPSGFCTPVHVDLEVWTDSIQDALDLYSNESFLAGTIGYRGSSAMYTTKEFIANALNESIYPTTFIADFWRDYARNELLIHELAAPNFFGNSEFYSPNNTQFCPDGYMGCQNGCAKSFACTQRERQGKTCMAVLLTDATQDTATRYFEALLSNLNIPAYFCFVGQERLAEYVMEKQLAHKPVFFYHWEPDVFHARHPGLFERVLFPKTEPERFSLATGTFGEQGYGMPTTNPVNVDYPDLALAKYAATVLTENELLQFFLSEFMLKDTDMGNLLKQYVAFSKNSAIDDDPKVYFDVACDWVRSNYKSWKTWMKRLPLCDLTQHVQHQLIGCGDSTNGNDTSVLRVIQFSWKNPSPENKSLPSACDGGLMTLPPSIKTSRSCQFLKVNQAFWMTWIDTKPTCDQSFYDFNVSHCNLSAKRTLKFFWLLTDPTNASLSLECQVRDGVSSTQLPQDLLIDCEYAPTGHPFVTFMFVLTSLITVFYLGAIVWVYKYRNCQVIKRSQYELLILMLGGGITMNVGSLMFAGEPDVPLCALRFFLCAVAFTTVFGSLLLKSVRVHRIFTAKSMKKRVISTATLFKWQMFLYSVDVVFLMVWAIMDFPYPRYKAFPVDGLAGTVNQLDCRCNTLVYPSLIAFWKALLLMLGGGFAFLIRKAPSDFQESFWIFCSLVVAVVTTFIILPMSYMVHMNQTTLFVFVGGTFQLATLLVILLMLVPKALAIKSGVAGEDTQNASARKQSSSYPQTSVESKADHPSASKPKHTDNRIAPSRSLIPPVPSP